MRQMNIAGIGIIRRNNVKNSRWEASLLAPLAVLQQIYGQEAADESRQRICIITDKLCHSAIHLYEEYGFKHIPRQSCLYQRGDYLMDNV